MVDWAESSGPRINVTVNTGLATEALKFSSIVGRDVFLTIGKDDEVSVDYHQVNRSDTEALKGSATILSWTSQ